MRDWNYTTVNGDEVVRHYAYTDVGFADAVNHADQFGYDVWESIDGKPTYCARAARIKA